MQSYAVTRDELLATDREEIGQLADAIIPARAGRPSATQVEVHTRHIDTALRARPDLVAPLGRALERLRAGNSGLASLDSDVLASVIELFIACYFMSPAARRAIEYSGQGPMPIAEGESEYYLEEEDVLAPVMARGQIWREART